MKTLKKILISVAIVVSIILSAWLILYLYLNPADKRTPIEIAEAFTGFNLPSGIMNTDFKEERNEFGAGFTYIEFSLDSVHHAYFKNEMKSYKVLPIPKEIRPSSYGHKLSESMNSQGYYSLIWDENNDLEFILILYDSLNSTFIVYANE